jgi:AraC-like DNA-binding protein
LNKIGNRFFGALIASVSFYLIIGSQMEYFQFYPKIFIASYFVIYLIFPLYFFQIKALLGEKIVWSPSYVVYFIPALVYVVLMIWVIVLPKEELRPRSPIYFSFLIADLISIIFNYYILYQCGRLLTYWKKEPTIENAGLGVFMTFHVAMFVCNSAWLYFIIPTSLILLPRLPFGIDVVYITMSFLIYFFAYALISRNHIFSKNVIKVHKAYQNTTIDTKTVDLISKNIIIKLQETKAYRDAEFSLDKLAKLTETDKFKLSYTISTRLNSSFTSLINKLRVDEFISVYQSDEYKHYNLMGIANEVGFKTKSTFYKAFKEFKGTTPLQYLEKDTNEDDMKSILDDNFS